MPPALSAFLKRHGFTLAVAGGMVAFELIIIGLLMFGQPAGNRWLGNTLQVPSDVAVYLSEIREGRVLIYNPYAVEAHITRFDPVWSTLGAIHWLTGASPVLLHELARILFTILLAFALHAAARSVASSEADARLGTLLMTGGIGLGWLYAVFLGIFNAWTPTTEVAPDLVREIAVAPVLLGGAHLILSFALLTIVMRGIWKGVHDRTRASWPIVATIVLLTFFHPYFIPLLAALIGMAWTKKLGRRPAHERTHQPVLIFLASLVPASAYYFWLLRDSIFGEHHLVANVVPLPPLLGSIFAFGPAIAALIWIAKRHDREQRALAVSRWCVAWLLAVAILCFLPVPWIGKLLEGLMVPLVLLTLPAWSAFFKWLPRQASIAVLVFVVAAAPLFFIASHASWLRHPDQAARLGRPGAIFHAWDFLKTRPGAVVITDDAWLNVWTPAWSNTTAWIGHAHETPGYTIKRRDWEQLLTTDKPEDVHRILQDAGATHLLFSSPAVRDRVLPLLSADWKVVFQEENVTVVERTNR